MRLPKGRPPHFRPRLQAPLPLSLWFGLLVFAGCAGVTPGTHAGRDLQALSKGVVLEQIRIRAAQIVSISAKARVRGTLGDEDFSLDEIILARRPGDLRLESLGPFGGTQLLLVVHDGLARVFTPSDRVCYVGEATVEVLADWVFMPIRPSGIVDILLSVPAGDDAESIREIAGPVEGAFRVEFRSGDGRFRRLWFEERTLRLVRAELGGGGDASLVDVQYGDYREIDGVDFPCRIDISSPGKASQFRIIMRDIEINAPIEEDLFGFVPPVGTTILPLEPCGP